MISPLIAGCQGMPLQQTHRPERHGTCLFLGLEDDRMRQVHIAPPCTGQLHSAPKSRVSRGNRARPSQAQGSAGSILALPLLGLSAFVLALAVAAGPASAQTLAPAGLAPPAAGSPGDQQAGSLAPDAGLPDAGLPVDGTATLQNILNLLDDGDGGTEALVGALTGTEDGMLQLSAYLDAGNADPDTVAARAEALLEALSQGNLIQDPVALQEALSRVEQAAGVSVAALSVMKTVVAPDFEIGDGRFGYDFGPADGEAMRGFRRVDVTADVFQTEDGTLQSLQAVRSPGGDPVLVDGVIGVQEVTLPAPNGRWRVVILSNDFGDTDRFGRPFGEELEVNGTTFRVPNASPAEWMDSIALTNARGGDVQAGNFSFVSSESRGGAVVLDTVVSGGMLRIRFKAQPGRPTLLSGIVLEPSDGTDSVLLANSEEAARQISRDPGMLQELRERRQAAEGRVQDAVGRALANLATAAGPQQDVASLLGPPAPAVDQGNTISAN